MHMCVRANGVQCVLFEWCVHIPLRARGCTCGSNPNLRATALTFASDPSYTTHNRACAWEAVGFATTALHSTILYPTPPHTRDRIMPHHATQDLTWNTYTSLLLSPRTLMSDSNVCCSISGRFAASTAIGSLLPCAIYRSITPGDCCVVVCESACVTASANVGELRCRRQETGALAVM